MSFALKVSESEVAPKSRPKFKKKPAAKVRKLCDLTANSGTVPNPAAARALALRHREAARKLALSMITKWKARLEPDELQSVIDLALCEAASRYNNAHGAAFMTFLYYHLKGKLIKTIAARADRVLLFVDDYEKARLSIHGDDETSDVRSAEWRTYSANLESPYQPEETYYRQQLIDLCHKACQRLKGVEREVIMRIYFENKDLNDVTSEMGYSRGHLFRVRMRALEKLRRTVGAQCR